MSMKIGLGLYRSLLTPENLRFARQVGVTHIVAHVPGGFSRGKGKVITSDRSAPGSVSPMATTRSGASRGCVI